MHILPFCIHHVVFVFLLHLTSPPWGPISGSFWSISIQWGSWLISGSQSYPKDQHLVIFRSYLHEFALNYLCRTGQLKIFLSRCSFLSLDIIYIAWILDYKCSLDQDRLFNGNTGCDMKCEWRYILANFVIRPNRLLEATLNKFPNKTKCWCNVGILWFQTNPSRMIVVQA